LTIRAAISDALILFIYAFCRLGKNGQ
jgi:hypothetical protein